MGDAGGGDAEVEAAEVIERGQGHGVTIGFAGHIDADVDRLSADFLDQRYGLRAASVVWQSGDDD